MHLKKILKLRVLIAYQVLVVAGPSCWELEVVPAYEEKQEEGKHEEFPVPHCQEEDLRRENMTV